MAHPPNVVKSVSGKAVKLRKVLFPSGSGKRVQRNLYPSSPTPASHASLIFLLQISNEEILKEEVLFGFSGEDLTFFPTLIRA